MNRSAAILAAARLTQPQALGHEARWHHSNTLRPGSPRSEFHGERMRH